MGWGVALTLAVVVLGSTTALTYLTPIDGTAVWIFLDASMLLAAAKGYGGCEVLAFANALTGERAFRPRSPRLSLLRPAKRGDRTPCR